MLGEIVRFVEVWEVGEEEWIELSDVLLRGKLRLWGDWGGGGSRAQIVIEYSSSRRRHMSHI